MRRALAVSVGVLILAALPAFAADLPARIPTKAQVAIAPSYNWNGFYIGGNVGVVSTRWDYTLSPTGCFLTSCGGGPLNNPFRTDSASPRTTSFTGGGQIGYNLQVSSLLLGVEADLNYNGLNATDSLTRALPGPSFVGTFAHSVSTKLDWFGTVRGRLGILVTPDWLWYATGGLAYGHVSSNTSATFSFASDTYVGSYTASRAGWTVGGGTEWAFDRNWSLKAEYLYVDLGSFSYADACVSPAALCAAFTPAPAYQTDLRLREHIGRIGLNYRFDWGPVVAKY
jgi:outer membrane immunogenic protein